MENSITCAGSVSKEVFGLLLEHMQQRSVRPLIEKAKKHSSDPGASYAVEDMLNNPCMNRDEVPLAMDIFRPEVPDGQELPVIVLIHGGGLVMGDRTMSRNYGRILAGRGYLVFSVEYRLAPRANVPQQLDDVCAGMDLIGRHLVDLNVDFTRMFLVGESAGALLAVYVAAMKQSEKLQKIIQYQPTRMRFKALGLISGMFYTQWNDPIGIFLAQQIYGDKFQDRKFMKYMNPENREIVENLPPVFMVTSRGDFLNNYTLMYHKKLKKAGKKTKLIYYGESSLSHAFVGIEPWRKQSRDATEKMLAWFEDCAREQFEKARAEQEAEKKLSSGKEQNEDRKNKDEKSVEKPSAREDANPPAAPARKRTKSAAASGRRSARTRRKPQETGAAEEKPAENHE